MVVGTGGIVSHFVFLFSRHERRLNLDRKQPKLQPPTDFRPWCNYDRRRYTHRSCFTHFFFSLSYLAIHVLFESGRIISNVTIPFDCLPVQVLETTETFHIQYAISACVLNVFYFLFWKDRASRFIFFKIKIKSINRFTMIIEKFQIWKVPKKRY